MLGRILTGLASLSAYYLNKLRRQRDGDGSTGKKAGRIKAADGIGNTKKKRDQGTATLISLPESRGTSRGN